MRMNIFIGENLGNNVFRIGILCLIGIAHLPEHSDWLKYKDSLSVNPGLSSSIGRDVAKAFYGPGCAPDRAQPVLGNLFHAIKLIASKALPSVPISGNVPFTDSWDVVNMSSQMNLDAETGISLDHNYASNIALLK